MAAHQKYSIITTKVNSNHFSTVYQDGQIIGSMIPTKFIQPIKTLTNWNTMYFPRHNIVIVAPYGLCGGGNCSAQVVRSNSSDKIKEKFKLNESTKDLSLNLSRNRISQEFLKDERKEAILKKLIYQISTLIESGQDFAYVIKQIEELEFSVGIGYYYYCVQILNLLGNSLAYVKTDWVFHREKLLSIAKKLLLFHVAYADHATDPGAYEAAKVALDKIWTAFGSNNPLPDTGFYINLKCVDMLIETINKTTDNNNTLAEYLQKVIIDKQNCKESSKSVNLYLKHAAKSNRIIICDIILLEFLGKHEDKQKVVRNIMDMHCSSSWENLAMILDYIIPCFKPIDSIQFLSEYLYFTSFDKDVWKVQSRVIELLVQLKGIYKEEFSNLIEMVLAEKQKVENLDNIKFQLKFLDLYENSVSRFFAFDKPQIGLEHFWLMPSKQVNLKKEENEDLWMLMGSFESKVLLINGPAGSGKTDLALSYALYARNKYKLMIFINCTSRGFLTRSINKIAKKAKLIEYETFQDTSNGVLKYLSKLTEKFLVIFDDVADIKLIKNLLPNAGHVIITSKDPIWDFRYELTCKSEKIGEALNRNCSQNIDKNLFKFCKNWKNYDVVVRSQKCLSLSTEKFSECEGLFELVFRTLEEKMGCGLFLLCLGRMKNFSVHKKQLQMIFECLGNEKNSLQVDLIFLYLVNLNLAVEVKSCKYILERDFFLFLRNKSEKIKSQVLNCLFTAFNSEWNYETLKFWNQRIAYSKLVSKHSLDLTQNSELSGQMLLHKGFYCIKYTKNYESGLKYLESSRSCFPEDCSTKRICLYLIGKASLLLNNLDYAISTFTNLLNSCSDINLTHLIKAYLIKSYEILGQGIKIRDIIFDPLTDLSKIEIPQACYFTIHGICRLFLTEKSLKKLIAPFSSLLTSHANSALLIKTLLKLSLFFSYKERWTTVLGYVNLIGPILSIPHILQPRNLSSTLDALISLLNQIKNKISEYTGENHQVLYTIHYILAKIYATLQDNENRRINLEQALEISKGSHSDNLDTAQAQFELAKYYGIKMKNIEHASGFLQQSEKTILLIAGEASILYARVLEMKGLLLLKKNNLVQAGELINKSFTIKQKILENSPDNEEISISYASLGKHAKKSGNMLQALHYYSKSLEPDHKIYYSSIWAAKAYKIALDLKHYKEALNYKSQQIRMLIHIYDSNSELVFNEYQKAYSLAIDIKSYEQANNFALASLDILRRISVNSEINYTESMYLIKVADSFVKLRNFDEAEVYLKEAVEIAKAKYSVYEFANAKCALGVFYKDIGKYAKAIVEMSEVLDNLDRKKKARIFTDIGLCYMKKKCIDEAASAFGNSLKLYKEEGMKLELGKTYILMSYLYKDEYSLSSKYLKKAIFIYNNELGEEHKETVSLRSRLDSLKNSSESSHI